MRTWFDAGLPIRGKTFFIDLVRRLAAKRHMGSILVVPCTNQRSCPNCAQHEAALELENSGHGARLAVVASGIDSPEFCARGVSVCASS